MLTPALSSDPESDEAPSRSTSIRSIAIGGISLRSTDDEPRPTDPLRLSSAEVWRRLPLISTRVWSGARPRSVAGRIESVPSVSDGGGKLNEGTSWVRTLLVRSEEHTSELQSL